MKSSSEAQIAEYIHSRFPNSTLCRDLNEGVEIFSIKFEEEILMVLDSEGVEFCFPVRGRKTQRWTSFLEGGPENIAKSFLQDLADAGFTTLRNDGRVISKRRVMIRKLICPGCGEVGSMRKIVYGMPDPETFEFEKYAVGGCCINGDGSDPDLRCKNCNWEGFRDRLSVIRLH